MGGSLCLALRAAHPAARISVWARNRERLADVESHGVADEYSIRPHEVIRDADVAVLCVPITAMKPLVEDLLETIPKRCLLTDVGSVKAGVERNLAPLISGRARWIGSHPMTGSEKSGFEAARADLYQGACTIITPVETTSESTIKDATAFWTSLGARVHTMSPEHHDVAVAAISHLPHLLASALVNATPPSALPLCGPGYRDSTRVAAGAAGLWRDILMENRSAVLETMAHFIDQAGTVRDLLRDGDATGLEQFLAAAAETRGHLAPVAGEPSHTANQESA